MGKFDKPELIYCYTRKQAIEDGVLVDITSIARQFGFVIPVAITANLMNRYVKPSHECEELGQSLKGRLADVLTMLNKTAQRRKLMGHSRTSTTVNVYCHASRDETEKAMQKLPTLQVG